MSSELRFYAFDLDALGLQTLRVGAYYAEDLYAPVVPVEEVAAGVGAAVPRITVRGKMVAPAAQLWAQGSLLLILELDLTAPTAQVQATATIRTLARGDVRSPAAQLTAAGTVRTVARGDVRSPAAQVMAAGVHAAAGEWRLVIVDDPSEDEALMVTTQ